MLQIVFYVNIIHGPWGGTEHILPFHLIRVISTVLDFYTLFWWPPKERNVVAVGELPCPVLPSPADTGRADTLQLDVFMLCYARL